MNDMIIICNLTTGRTKHKKVTASEVSCFINRGHNHGRAHVNNLVGMMRRMCLCSKNLAAKQITGHNIIVFTAKFLLRHRYIEQNDI